jgi:hypothetical protein
MKVFDEWVGWSRRNPRGRSPRGSSSPSLQMPTNLTFALTLLEKEIFVA